MNHIEEVKTWNDQKLAQGVIDIKEFKETSVLPEGSVREFSKKLLKI
jgi:hypothetical protein